jgi:hypothetical protein
MFEFNMQEFVVVETVVLIMLIVGGYFLYYFLNKHIDDSNANFDQLRYDAKYAWRTIEHLNQRLQKLEEQHTEDGQ